MPELPEVERARKLIHDSCTGYKIKKVETTEDKIVYTGGDDHEAFAKEIEGRTITGCERKGKIFWMTLDGGGRLPVMHFGMNGMIQLKGQEPTWYKRRPRERAKVWPPKYYKFTMELEPQDGSVSTEPRDLAFIDSRRLARLRLVPAPVIEHPPVSALGFDPMLSYPTFEEFQKLIAKKNGTVKGMIMNQAFSAGVGNWVADEILYQARIHPACPIPHLSPQNVIDLHKWIRKIPEIAVSVNADHAHFPEDWLFRWRWSKGKKQKNRVESDIKRKEGKGKGKGKVEGNDVEGKEEGDGESEVDEDVIGEEITPKGKEFFALPDGSPATISFIEVSGRTTAFVEELQKMPEGVAIKPKITKGGKGSQSKKKKGDDSDEGGSSPLSGDDGADRGSEAEESKPNVSTPRQKAAAKRKVKVEEDDVKVENGEGMKAKKRVAKRVKAEPTGETRADLSVSDEKVPDKKSRATRPSAKSERSGRTSVLERAQEENGVVSSHLASRGSSELSDVPE